MRPGNTSTDRQQTIHFTRNQATIWDVIVLHLLTHILPALSHPMDIQDEIGVVHNNIVKHRTITDILFC